jgi:hypothetical protein
MIIKTNAKSLKFIHSVGSGLQPGKAGQGRIGAGNGQESS